MTKLRDHPVWNKHVAEEQRKRQAEFNKLMESETVFFVVMMVAMFIIFVFLPDYLR